MKKLFIILSALFINSTFATDIRTDCINKSYTDYVTEGLYKIYVNKNYHDEEKIGDLIELLHQSKLFFIKRVDISPNSTFIHLKESNQAEYQHMKIVRTLLNIEKLYAVKVKCAKFF